MAVVLAEDDVEHPTQRVLDAPMPADGSDQDGGIVAAAGEEVAGLGLAGSAGAAERLRRQRRARPGPAAQGLGILCRRVHEDAAADQTAVAPLEGAEHRPAAGSAAKAGALEALAHRLESAAVVGL